MGNARCQPRATLSGDHGMHSQSAVKSLMQGTDIQGEVSALGTNQKLSQSSSKPRDFLLR